MARRFTFFLMLGMLAMISFQSCKKNSAIEVADLVFPTDVYYLPQGQDVMLHINQGNLQYDLSVGDSSMLSASADASAWPAGRLWVKGLKKGETTLLVKDKVSGKEVSLKMNIVDPYLIIRVGSLMPLIKVKEGQSLTAEQQTKIREEAQKSGKFSPENLLVLRRKESPVFAVYKDRDAVAKGESLQEGSYLLQFSYGGPHRLTFNMDNPEESSSMALHFLNQIVFQRLLDFSNRVNVSNISLKMDANVAGSLPSFKTGDIMGQTPIYNYDDSFLIYQDLTQKFQANYPAVQAVELFQEMRIWHDYQNYGFKIAPVVFSE